VREISVSLEDVYFGTVKKFKVRRQRYNAQKGILREEERILEVPINRGLKPGSKIKFEGAGDQTPEGTRELHFKLAEVSVSCPLLRALLIRTHRNHIQSSPV
jgi:DnaJ family protein B protein 4